MRDHTCILYITNNETDVASVERMLLTESAGFYLKTAPTLSSGLEHLTSRKFDLILVDPNLPDCEGKEALNKTIAAAADVPLLVLTEIEDEGGAIQTPELNPFDRVCKRKLDAYHLRRSIRHALERSAWARDLEAQREKLVRSEQRFQKLITENPDAILIIDKNGYVRFANPAVEALFDRAPEQLISKQFGFPITGQRVIELEIVRSTPEKIVAEARVQEVEWDGEQAYLAILRDITQHKQLEKALQDALETEQYMSQHDSLTELPNRQLLDDRLEHAIEQARRSGDEVALLFLDLNNFKHINDSMGHQGGDKVLKEVAQRLRNCIRDSDTIARMGGDEFIIVLERIVSRENVVKVAEKIVHEISPPIQLEHQQFSVSASIGIAFFPHDGLTSQAILSNADTAMYRAKKKGQDYVFYDYGNDFDFTEYIQLKKHLYDVVSNRELRVYYQPQLSLSNNEIVGAEALVRWQHPKLGILPPARFIDLAEESGLIVPIGEWVLETACRQTVSWSRKGKCCFRISVNLSPRQFYALHLDSLQRILKETHLESGQLVLEITEACAIQNASYTTQVLSELRKMGVGIALDNFGRGYASLNYLKQFPIDIIKLDHSFIKELHKKRTDWTITTTLVDMARRLNLRVVAEGVERREQLCYLRSLKCNEYQGFYFSKPLPEDAITELLGKQRGNSRSLGAARKATPETPMAHST